MCGIAGFVRLSGQGGGEEILQRMAECLRHRGPDAQGTFLEEEGRAGFAHRRLAVIDLSETGAQPMVDSDLGLTAVFNGIIYNYKQPVSYTHLTLPTILLV